MVSHHEVKKLEKSAVKLTLTIPQNEVEKEYQNILNTYCQKLQIKGFRPGKVPPAVLEKKFFKELKGETLSNLLESGLKEVFEEIPEKPLSVSTPNLEGDVDLDRQSDLTFSVVYDILPTINLGSYKGIEVSENKVVIEKEDEEKALLAVQKQNAIYKEKDALQGVKKSDIVTFDFCRLDDNGTEIAKTKREDFTFTVGTAYNYYQLDDELLDLKVNEEKIIDKTYSAEHENPELKGQTIRLKVKIKKIKEEQLPALDDELAQDVSSKYQTLADLKQGLKTQLEENAANKLKAQMLEELRNKISEASQIDLPESLINMELGNVIRQFQRQANLDEKTLLQVLADSKENNNDLVAKWRPLVEKNLKLQFIMIEIAKLEKIEIVEADFTDFFAKEAERSGTTVEVLEKYFASNNLAESLRENLLDQKVNDFILENSKKKSGKKLKYSELINEK